MSSKVKSLKIDNEDFGGRHLLRDIEEISHALYLHINLPKALNTSSDHRPNVVSKSGISESRNKFKIQDSWLKDKKSSIWNWKPLKALTHTRNHRFNCCFFLHVHAIEGLPSNFNNLNLCVTWKRKDEILRTRLARVCARTAEFEETLMHRCTVYGSRNRPHNSTKYEPKLFLLHASVPGAPTLDIGKHWIDLTRLLPLTLEELERDRRSSGKWSTSFKLTGRAKGATLNVSFGFSIMDDNSFEPDYFVNVFDVEKEGGLTRADYIADFDQSTRTSQLNNLGSVPTISTQGLHCQSQSLDVKFVDEIFPNREPELAQSISLLYRKLDEENMRDVMGFDLVCEHMESLRPKVAASIESAIGNIGHGVNDTEFTVIEQGEVKIEQLDSQRFDSSLIEIIDVAEIFDGEEMDFDENVECYSKLDTNNHSDTKNKDNGSSIKESTVEDLDSVLYDMMISRSTELDSLLGVNKYYEQEKFTKTKSRNKENMLTKSLSLDDAAESIENDFLNMLSIEQNPDYIVFNSFPDSPRDLFLRQFEEDTGAWGNMILDTKAIAEQNESCCLAPSGYGEEMCADDFGLPLAILAGESSHGSVTHSLKSTRNAKLIENLETEALMHEWGLNENAFQNSPCNSSGGFGSPVYLPPEEPLKLPSLGEGLGPSIWTKDGGLLRSMNPLLFRNANNGARLILQVSAPVVLPAAMGFTVMEILQCWASGGAEKMSIRVNELMPFEDITGKTIRQLVSDAESISDAFKRWASQNESEVGHESSVGKKEAEKLPFALSSDTLHSRSTSEEIYSDYVSFENLVPLAITNIEGLLIEGLKIQSGMPDQEAPSSIRIQFIGSSAEGNATELGGNVGSERASGLQVLDVDELVKYSVSMEEWMRLDSEKFDADDETDENVWKLLAHSTRALETSGGLLIGGDERIKWLGSNCGALNNNFIMALKVQLRDPLRDDEMVGSSMLALIEVETVYSTKMHCTSLEKFCNNEKNDLDERLAQEGTGFEQKKLFFGKGIPRFKVSEGHLTGLNAVLGNKELWGNDKQQQSGSRWLLSSGMGKTNKNHGSNANAIIKPSSRIMGKAWPGDVLWSISSCIQGGATTWDEMVALNVHVRNPDIIFPQESVSFPR